VREFRECACPEWVIKCAHWEGRVLALSDLKHGLVFAHHGTPPANPTTTFSIREGGEFFLCDCHGTPGRSAIEAGPQHGFPDEESALAEFTRREALLR